MYILYVIENSVKTIINNVAQSLEFPEIARFLGLDNFVFFSSISSRCC